MITAAEVAAWLKLSAADDHLDTIVDAVNGMVTEWHGETWPPGVALGAKMLAARLHKRRGSADGLAAFGDMGAVYVSRNDPDVALLLELGAYAKPAVG